MILILLYVCFVQQLEFSAAPGMPKGYTAVLPRLLHTGAAVLRSQNKKGHLNGNWKGGNKTLICIVCHKLFDVIPSRSNKAKYCSLHCWNLFQKENPVRHVLRHPRCTKGIRRTEWVHKECRQCGLKMEMNPSLSRVKHFCSKECQFKWRSEKFSDEGNPNYKHGGKRTCKHCGKEFISRALADYCSLKHARKHRVGELAPAWKGGLVQGNMKIRLSKDYAEWRMAVFARDNFTCQECGVRGGKLTAHHIKTFSSNPDLRLFVPNGITICWPCHSKLKGKEPLHESRLGKKISLLL